MVDACRRTRFQHWLEYGIYLVAVDALAPLLQHLLLDVGDRAAALPLGASLARQERLSVPGLAVAVVVLGKGLAVRPVVGVEVLEEAELVMALGLDQFVLPDQEPVLLDVVPLQRAVVAVVTHLRLQTGLTPSANSVNELPNIYSNDGLWSLPAMDVPTDARGMGAIRRDRRPQLLHLRNGRARLRGFRHSANLHWTELGQVG